MTMERDSLVARLEALANRIRYTGVGGKMYPRPSLNKASIEVVASELDEIAAALSRPEQVVMALEWHKHQRDDIERYSADPVFAQYIITWTASGYELFIGFWGSAAEPRPPFFAKLDDAKAAAQADYEQRILSALHPAPEAASAGVAGEMDDDDRPFPNAVMERLYQAARAVADNIAEFGTVTDGERIDALDAALNALSDTAPSPKGVSDGVRDVLAERRRQIEAEGWTPEHDDEHRKGELLSAAKAYFAHALGRDRSFPPTYNARPGVPFIWPWDAKWWKPKTPREDLIRAGALALAEIERIQRNVIEEAVTRWSLDADVYYRAILAEIERLDRAALSQEAVHAEPERKPWPEPGDKLVYLDKNGYDSDRDHARAHMKKGDVFTLAVIKIGDWSHSLEFEELRGRSFNGVMFDYAFPDAALSQDPVPATAEERAAPAQQPVAWQTRMKPTGAKVWGDWHFGKMTADRDGWDVEERPLYAATSEPELRAEIVRLTRRADMLEKSAGFATDDVARLEQERTELRAKLAEARAAAFEEAAQIAERCAQETEIFKVQKHLRRAATAIRSRAALDKGATR